jgi:hypothetical protein
MEELAHDSAANGQVMELTLLKDSDPGLERFTPTSNGFRNKNKRGVKGPLPKTVSTRQSL